MTGIVSCTECKSDWEHADVGMCPACYNYNEMSKDGIDIGHTGHRWHGYCKKCKKVTLMEEWLVD